jgi:hypothetical protein
MTMYGDLQDPMTEDKAVISMHVDVDEVSQLGCHWGFLWPKNCWAEMNRKRSSWDLENTSFSMTVWLESWQCENVHQFPVIFQWGEYASVSLCIQDYEVLWGFHLSPNTIDPRLCPGRCANCWKVKSLIANLLVWEKHPRSGSEFSNSVSPTNASNIYLESHEHYSLTFFQIM